mmetsp:Transcript_13718/g.39012  ORF Transcript_13718/g.39012 Transcript_13718/m.39012 type:complete len:554 (+) Transcript_13718:265-1926(+)
MPWTTRAFGLLRRCRGFFGLAPGRLEALLGLPELQHERLVRVDAELAPDMGLPVFRAWVRLPLFEHGPAKSARAQRVVEERQALAVEVLQRPYARALAAPAQLVAGVALLGKGPPRDDAHLREAVRVEHDGELELLHAVCPALRHLLEDRVRHGAGLGRPPGLAQELGRRLGAEVALDEQHGLLDAVLPLRVDLCACGNLLHCPLELPLHVAGPLAGAPRGPGELHLEDVGAADRQAVAVGKLAPVLVDHAAVHPDQAATEGSHREPPVVLVHQGAYLGADVQPCEHHPATLGVRPYCRLPGGQVVDQAPLKGAIGVQVHELGGLGYVVHVDVHEVHAQLGQLRFALPLLALALRVYLGLVQREGLLHGPQGIHLGDQLQLPRLLRLALLLEAHPQLLLRPHLVAALLLLLLDLREPPVQRVQRLRRSSGRRFLLRLPLLVLALHGPAVAIPRVQDRDPARRALYAPPDPLLLRHVRDLQHRDGGALPHLRHLGAAVRPRLGDRGPAHDAVLAEPALLQRRDHARAREQAVARRALEVAHVLARAVVFAFLLL